MKQKVVALLLIVAALLTCTNMAFAVSEDIAVPACSCQNENTDLSVHSDSCARKAYCGTLATNYTAQELFDMWGALPTDVRAFLPTRVSWNDWNKYQELLKLLENFTEEPEQPSEPPLIEEPNSCTCEPQYPYGSTKHDADCIFCFTKLPVEDQFITYTTMTDAQRSEAMGLLDSEGKKALEAHIAAHPFTSTVSEDGISVTAIDVPQGATVTAEVVDKEFTESILPSITLANQADFALDIKVYDKNGNEYQPDSENPVMLKVSLPEATNGQKTDFLHILDTPSAIEKGLADGSVKLLDLSHLFVGENEDGEIIEVTPQLDDAYWLALSATKSLGYEKQLAYELITGTCVDDGYSTVYIDSFSTFSNSSLDSGTYYIGWDLTGDNGTGEYKMFSDNSRGYYASQSTSVQRHQYYHTEIGNVVIPSGKSANFVFVRSGIPMSGKVTVQGTLNAYLYDGSNVDMYRYENNIVGKPQWDYVDAKSLNSNQLYPYQGDYGYTIYRTSGNTDQLFNVTGTLNLYGQNASTRFVINGNNVANAGAAIVSSGSVNLNYVTIRNNHCSGNGGAIYLAGSKNNTLSNVIVSNCSATGNGGGIHVASKSTATATFSNVSISNCSATGGAGIAFCGYGNQTVSGSSISDCQGVGGTAMLIVTESGEINVSGTKVYNNSTIDDRDWGGTIRTYGSTRCKATFTDCDVYDNYSHRHGGGFYWNAGGDALLVINSCNIYNNSVGWCGGGIFCETNIKIQGNTNIYSNTADGLYLDPDIDSPGGGGGICTNAYKSSGTTGMDGSKLELASTIRIYKNTSKRVGGGIYMHVYQTPSLIDNAEFLIKLNGAELSENSAEEGGGVCILRSAGASGYKCSATLNYGKLENNTATTGNGGGIFTKNANVEIGNTSGTAMTITENKALSGLGGAVYSIGTLGACSITNGTLTSNYAKSGGAIALEDCSVSVNGGTISSNTASEYGGAIYSSGTGAFCTVSNGTLQSNTAKYGGAIAVINGNITVNGGTISSNTASQYGGGIGVANGAATINGGAINSNEATLCGGGIFTAGTAGSVNVSGNGSVSSNTAANGGGIYATQGASVNVTGGIIRQNTATGTTTATTAFSDAATSGVGGGIYVGNGTDAKSSSVTISGTQVGIYSNTATFAAADAFASGTYTSITLPAVTNMNLTGFEGNATGWYEDYADGDTAYSSGFASGTVGERYVNARNTYEITSATGVTKYAAITLGISRKGYGNLTIQAKGTNVDPDQVFIYTVSGNGINLQISLKGNESITIYELPDGTYTVTEMTNWSWRYTPSKTSYTDTISGTNVNPHIIFEHSRTNNDWLSALFNLINVKG